MDARVVSEIPLDATICCVDAETFKGNKNDIRDVGCSKCSRQVVMGDTTFREYLKAGRKHRVLCRFCALEEMEGAKGNCEALVHNNDKGLYKRTTGKDI